MPALIGVFFLGVLCGIVTAAFLHAAADADERGEFDEQNKGDGPVPTTRQNSGITTRDKEVEAVYKGREKTDRRSN